MIAVVRGLGDEMNHGRSPPQKAAVPRSHRLAAGCGDDIFMFSKALPCALKIGARRDYASCSYLGLHFETEVRCAEECLVSKWP